VNEDQPLPATPLLQGIVRSTLLALLESDDQVQQAVRQLITSPASPGPQKSAAVIQHQPFGPELELLDWISTDPALKDAWLSVDEPVERQLVRLIAIASQWDRLLLLWDRLAARCKDEQRSASSTGQRILTRSLELHNLVWREHQASLQTAQAGAFFDPLLYERGMLHGDAVSEQWLPGLRNAAGQLQRKPLVRT
jgi:hypothetical protein